MAAHSAPAASGADPVDEHHGKREIALAIAREQGQGRRQDDAGDVLVAHHVQVEALLLRILVGIAQHHPHAVGVGDVLDGAADLHEIRIADIRHDQAQRVGAP